MATGGYDPMEKSERSKMGDDPDFMAMQLALSGLLADDEEIERFAIYF